MSIDQITSLLVTITLIELMVTVGLSIQVSELAGVAQDWRLAARAMLANYIVVPAATLGLLMLFGAHPMVVAGFLILAVSPGAPFGPAFAAIAKGNVVVAVGLMVLLAGSSAVLAPILLALLLKGLPGNEPLAINSSKVAATLLVTQLMPLCVGLAVRHWRPALADRLQPPAKVLSKALNLAVVVVILAVQYRSLSEMTARALAGMLSLLIVCFAAGYLLSTRENATRRAMTLTTSLRNVGVGLVIATGSFPGTAAVTAVLTYGLVELAGSLLLAVWWGRHPSALENGQGV